MIRLASRNPTLKERKELLRIWGTLSDHARKMMMFAALAAGKRSNESLEFDGQDAEGMMVEARHAIEARFRQQSSVVDERTHLLRLSWDLMNANQRDHLLLAAGAILARRRDFSIYTADDNYTLQRGIAEEIAKVMMLDD
nr:hypothetical protein [uncultured Roseococcus sp.]